MMNNDSAKAKKYLDLLTYAKYCCYSDQDSHEVKQFKDGLYLTELKMILEKAKKESDNTLLLAFLQKYYEYLDNIKDQTLRNYYNRSETRHKNIMGHVRNNSYNLKLHVRQDSWDKSYNLI